MTTKLGSIVATMGAVQPTGYRCGLCGEDVGDGVKAAAHLVETHGCAVRPGEVVPMTGYYRKVVRCRHCGHRQTEDVGSIDASPRCLLLLCPNCARMP